MSYIKKCPCCGGELSASEESLWAVCKSCRAAFSPDELKIGHDFPELTAEKTCSANGYSCRKCGAEIIVNGHERDEAFCVCCGAPAVEPTHFESAFVPDSVLPFKLDRTAAKQAFRAKFRKKPLSGGGLSEAVGSGSLKGIYVPCRVFGCGVETRIFAACSDSDGAEITAYRKFLCEFENIQQSASAHFDDKLLRLLAPFDYTKETPYSKESIDGYLAENGGIPMSDSVAALRERAEELALREARDKVSDGAARISSCSHSLTELKSRTVLLPVWVLNHTQNGHTDSYYMNGQTGKIIGSVPVSPKSCFLWFCAAAAASAAIGEFLWMVVKSL